MAVSKYVVTEKQTRADVIFNVETGGDFRFGEIYISGDVSIPLEPVIRQILEGADIHPGASFRLNKLVKAQENIYNLKLFSIVNVIPKDHRLKV